MFFYLYFVLVLAVIVYILKERNKKFSSSLWGDKAILIEHVPEAYQEMITLIEANKESDKFSEKSTTVDLESSTSTSENPQKMKEDFVNPQKHKKYNVPLLSLLLGRRNGIDQTAPATLLPRSDRLTVDASTEISKGIRKHSKSEQCFKAKGYPLSLIRKVSVSKEMTINQKLQSNISGDIQSQHQVNHEFGKNPTLIASVEMKAAASVVHAQIDYEEDFMHDKQITTKKNVQINEQNGTGFVVNKAESMLISNNQVIDKAETYFTNDVVTNGYDFGDKDLDLRITTKVTDFWCAKSTTPEAFSGYGVTDLMTIIRKDGNGEDKFITAEKEHGNAGGGYMSGKQVVVNTGTGPNIN